MAEPEDIDDLLLQQVLARAHRYGRRWDEALWRYHEVAALKRLLRERPALAAGPVLDLGCGDGELFGWIFGLRPDAAGVDSGATRLDDVRRARQSLAYGEVRDDDAGRLSFEPGRFGLVFSNSVLEHIAPVEPVLREVQRVLAPGGHFLFTTPDPLLYSAEGYGWREALGGVGLDGLGRLIARRECQVYRHVSILGGATWQRCLSEAGLDLLERRTYLPRSAARPMTLYSGATRIPLLARFAASTSAAARALAEVADADEAAWTARARQALLPLLARRPEEPGCGQLVLAHKPPTRAR